MYGALGIDQTALRSPASFIPEVHQQRMNTDIPKTVREGAEAAQMRAWREGQTKRKTETPGPRTEQHSPDSSKNHTKQA